MSESFEKPWWQSRAVVASIVTVAASLAGIAGYTLDEPMVTELFLSITTFVSGAVSWYGRIEAKKIISKTQVFPGVTKQ